MWPFSTSVLKKTESNAERSVRTYQACIIELRRIDHALRRLERRLPSHMQSNTLDRFQSAMMIEERNAEQMLTRTRTMREHIEKLEKTVVAVPSRPAPVQKKAA